MTRHNPFFLMQNIHSLLSKNEIYLLGLMNFTFYFEIKRKNTVFFRVKKGYLSESEKDALIEKMFRNKTFFDNTLVSGMLILFQSFHHSFLDYISELEMVFFHF